MVRHEKQNHLGERPLRHDSDFDVIPRAANWLNVAGITCCVTLLISYLVLPVKQTSRHYLTVGLVIALIIMQVGLDCSQDKSQAHQTSWDSSYLSLPNLSSATMQSLLTTCILTLRAPSQALFYYLVDLVA